MLPSKRFAYHPSYWSCFLKTVRLCTEKYVVSIEMSTFLRILVLFFFLLQSLLFLHTLNHNSFSHITFSVSSWTIFTSFVPSGTPPFHLSPHLAFRSILSLKKKFVFFGASYFTQFPFSFRFPRHSFSCSFSSPVFLTCHLAPCIS